MQILVVPAGLAARLLVVLALSLRIMTPSSLASARR